MTLTLYSYFRSSAAYRVRIGLNLKGVDYLTAPVNLLRSEQGEPAYKALNPQGLVPALELPDGSILTQSGAILEWLDNAYPAQPLLPAEPLARARVRAICDSIACDIHPLNNLRVLQYLTRELGVSETQKNAWYHHWLQVGFSSLEQQVGDGPCCTGTTPGMADVFLVPQIANAVRLHFDMAPFPRLMRINDYCSGLEAFARAHPDAQPDRPAP